MEHPVDISKLATQFDQMDARDPGEYEQTAELVMSFQRAFNPIYGRFAPHVFLPVRAFKDATLTCFPPSDAEAVFVSSGTGNQERRSRHHVFSLAVYRRAVASHFRFVFGKGPFTFIFFLPDDARGRHASSLITMARILQEEFGTRASGFMTSEAYQFDHAVADSLQHGHPVIVFGTAFALADFVEAAQRGLPEDSLVIETGGMKTHRREIDRGTLHRMLSEGFALPRKHIRSEYGMCELLSQFYTRGDMLFYPPPWVRFSVRDPHDPTREVADGTPGALAVFDIANMYSVSGILTEDRAVKIGDGFDLQGRLSGAELRGCNFLMEELR